MATNDGSFSSLTNGNSSEGSFEEDSAYSSPHSQETLLSPQPLNDADLFTITCNQCGNTFIEPKVLSCFHSFCSICLETRKCDNSVACSICGTVTLMPPNGTAGLPPDFRAINIINFVKGKIFCTSCKHGCGQAIAVAKCCDCHSYLCNDCVLAHNYMHIFTEHRVVHFSNMGEVDHPDGASGGEELTYCLKHKMEELKYFCHYCNVPCCDICITTEHLSETHNYDLIAKESDSLLKDMNKSLDDMKAKAADYRQKKDFADQSVTRLCVQYQESKNKINETYEYYIVCITKYKTEQLKLLNKAFSLMHEVLSRNTTSAERLCTEYEQRCDFFSRLLKTSTVTQCSVLKQQFESKIDKIEDQPKRISPLLRFINNLSAITCAVPNSFGIVDYKLDGERGGEVGACKLLTAYQPQALQVQQSGQEELVAASLLERLAIAEGAVIRSRPWSTASLTTPDLSALLDTSFEIPPLRIGRSLRSIVTRTQIAFNYRFGSYGNFEGQFSEPNGVAVNGQEDIIIADTNNNRVQVFDKVGVYKFQFGDTAPGTGQRQLLFPNRVAVCLSTGDIVVTERSPTHQVQIFSASGRFVRRFGADILQHPRALTVDVEDTIIIVECKVMRVILFNQYGKLLHKFLCGSDLKFPNGVAVNTQKEIFISDNRSHCVMVFDYNGNRLRNIGQEGVTNFPIGVLISPRGYILIADNHNNFNLTLFTPDGQLIAGMESKIKHAQCFDVALSKSNMLVLTCKDFFVYLYALTNI